MVSTIVESLRLAPVRRMASGVPLRSVGTWRLLPGRPRFVGFGPVSSPPFFAGMLALSSEARLQSICLDHANSCKTACRSRSHILAACQSRRRRQQVIPEPPPYLDGQGFPGNARSQDEQDAGQRFMVTNRRTPGAARWLGWRQQRFDDPPKPIWDKGAGHTPSTAKTPFY
jgi:hypothetical protein